MKIDIVEDAHPMFPHEDPTPPYLLLVSESQAEKYQIETLWDSLRRLNIDHRHDSGLDGGVLKISIK